MTKTQVKAAISEAKRFISAAQSALNLADKTAGDSMWQCKENASAKRASLDLTRVLADMRRSQ